MPIGLPHDKVIMCVDFIRSPNRLSEFDIELVDLNLCTHLILKDSSWMTGEGTCLNL